MSVRLQILNQRYTSREIWALRAAIAGALTPRRVASVARTVAAARLHDPRLLADPVLLLVEPSSRCNLACRFCPSPGDRDHDRGDLDLDRYRRLLDEVGDTLLFLCLWFYGEPLLHPHIARIVAMARERGVLVALSTNGVALDERTANDLLDAGLSWLFVSLDGPSEEEHDLNRGEGSYRAAVENVRRFVTLRNRRGRAPLVELKPILHRANVPRRDAMMDLARDLGVDRVTFQLLTWQHDPGLRAFLPDDPALVLDYDGHRPTGGCRRAWTSAVVGWDGTILPCCEDHARSLALGHVDAGFRAAWHGPRYRALRESLQGAGANRPSLCQTCHVSDFDVVNLTFPVERP